ncbi:glucosamine-6-phosphate deaminase [Virgibacillus sp. 179-BFC.A HS]|uniref:Glucosamine-6-phosphate deaminase n=1 Tax=Tigheibacillus jepli TaxID=3035914 RepID=A0ABU5CFG7_9BACI|nr:glucosamine-6-phosphate deaminase [Virgibacillus sp. 179-BFC.A HS]MDY0405078.1 glucosamine-6-phosphate deaminase [Virgibacillus sp. 179-BFC.A HS]
MEIIKVKDYDALSDKAGELIAAKLKELKKPVLGLATGSTPEGLYQRLIEKYKRGEITFKHASSYNLDEYVGMKKDDPNSYRYYMNEKLFKHVDIPLDQTHVPAGDATNPEEACKKYEQAIQAAGGIDIQILGMGLNGHIGFNEPNTPFTAETHVVDLDESTRKANARFFASLDDVPTQAMTMGIATIMRSKEILLLVSGDSKAETLAKVIQGNVTEAVPASVLQNHPHVTIIADEAALSKLND